MITEISNSTALAGEQPNWNEELETFVRNGNYQDYVQRAWLHLARRLAVPDAGAAIGAIVAGGPDRAGEIVARLIVEMSATGLKPATVNANLSGLRAFMNHLYVTGRIAWVLNVKSLQLRFRAKNYDLPNDFSFDLNRILANDGSKPVVRDRAVLALFGYHALKRGQVAALSPEDVRENGRFLRVILPTGRFFAHIELSELTSDCINRWLGLRDMASPRLFHSLIPGRQIGGLSFAAIYEIVRDRCGTQVNPNALRQVAIKKRLKISNSWADAGAEQVLLSTDRQLRCRFYV